MPSSAAERSEILRRLTERLPGDAGGTLLLELERLGLSLRLSDSDRRDGSPDPLPLITPPGTGQVRVAVLGGFRMTVGGSAVDTSGLRPIHREVLAALGMSAGLVINREQLAGWFWPDLATPRAQHNLHVAISAIRRLLEPHGARDIIRRNGSGYELQISDRSGCDVRDLENLVRLAALAARRGDRDRSAAHLDAAVRLYRGPLLSEFGYPDWVLAERDRIRQLVGDACEALARLRSADGQHAAAVTAARSGLSHDRDRDALWRILIGSLRALGEPVTAAAAQRRYDAMLHDLESDGSYLTSQRLRSVG